MKPCFPIRAAALLALLPAGCESTGVLAPEPVQPAFATTHDYPAELPFYARVEQPFTIHTDEWAVIVFYRPPSCVPAGFNLLDFFDVPAVFGCAPMTVAARDLRKDPDPYAAPFQSEAKGLGAVPVWLVGWHQLHAALGDGTLTMAELESLPSLLKGEAFAYQELLQPIPTRVPSRLVMDGQGTLEDGRRFQFHYASHDDFTGNDVRSVSVRIW